MTEERQEGWQRCPGLAAAGRDSLRRCIADPGLRLFIHELAHETWAQTMSDLVYRNHPLPEWLALAVPLRLLDLEEQGGPAEVDWETARRFVDELASKGDPILYRGLETAPLVGKLAFALAVLSYAVGGVSFSGLHWESEQASDD